MTLFHTKDAIERKRGRRRRGKSEKPDEEGEKRGAHGNCTFTALSLLSMCEVNRSPRPSAS